MLARWPGELLFAFRRPPPGGESVSTRKATSPNVLEKANAKEADMIIAVTNNDGQIIGTVSHGVDARNLPKFIL